MAVALWLSFPSAPLTSTALFVWEDLGIWVSGSRGVLVCLRALQLETHFSTRRPINGNGCVVFVYPPLVQQGNTSAFRPRPRGRAKRRGQRRFVGSATYVEFWFCRRSPVRAAGLNDGQSITKYKLTDFDLGYDERTRNDESFPRLASELPENPPISRDLRRRWTQPEDMAGPSEASWE